MALCPQRSTPRLRRAGPRTGKPSAVTESGRPQTRRPRQLSRAAHRPQDGRAQRRSAGPSPPEAGSPLPSGSGPGPRPGRHLRHGAERPGTARQRGGRWHGPGGVPHSPLGPGRLGAQLLGVLEGQHGPHPAPHTTPRGARGSAVTVPPRTGGPPSGRHGRVPGSGRGLWACTPAPRAALHSRTGRLTDGQGTRACRQRIQDSPPGSWTSLSPLS